MMATPESAEQSSDIEEQVCGSTGVLNTRKKQSDSNNCVYEGGENLRVYYAYKLRNKIKFNLINIQVIFCCAKCLRVYSVLRYPAHKHPSGKYENLTHKNVAKPLPRPAKRLLL